MNSLAAIAVLLALPRVTAQCAPGTVAFSEHVITTLADDGQSVFAVDVDGDGDADILTASNYDDTVAWYENDGSQSFAENVLTNSANGANFVFAADVDGDADVDVLASAGQDNSVTWFENDGSGGFTGNEITASDTFVTYVFAADVDGDGDVDVLSAAYSGETVKWFENDGSGGFTEHTIASSKAGSKCAFAIDVDGDGDVDVIGATRVPMDGDGDVDALTALFNADDVAWYVTTGSEFGLRKSKVWLLQCAFALVLYFAVMKPLVVGIYYVLIPSLVLSKVAHSLEIFEHAGDQVPYATKLPASASYYLLRMHPELRGTRAGARVLGGGGAGAATVDDVIDGLHDSHRTMGHAAQDVMLIWVAFFFSFSEDIQDTIVEEVVAFFPMFISPIVSALPEGGARRGGTGEAVGMILVVVFCVMVYGAIQGVVAVYARAARCCHVRMPKSRDKREFLSAARAVFDIIDVDGNGSLDRAEIVARVARPEVRAFLEDSGDETLQGLLSPGRLEAALGALDTNSDGKIDAREWESAIEVALAKTFGDGGSERGDGDVVLAPAAVDRARRADAWTFGESARVPAVDFDSAGSAVADFNAVEDASSPVPLALDEGAPEATPPTSPGILVIRADDPSPESE